MASPRSSASPRAATPPSSRAALRLHHLRLCASVAAYSLSDADALLLLRAARVAGTTGLAAAAAAAPAAATAAITYDSADADVDADGGADDAASLRTTLTAAESAAEAQLRLEVQMQLLFVIGVVAERPAPPAYFSFDGSGVLPLPPVTRFPSARTGFTLSFWLRLDALPPTDDDVPVLLLPAPGGGRLFEIALQRRAADSSNALPLRALLVRTCAGETIASGGHGDTGSSYRFDAHGFAECGGWHHVMLTHSRAGASLIVDGELAEATAALAYPELRAARMLGAKSPPPPPEPSPFCGQLSAVHLLEGCCDAAVAARLYARGAASAEQLRAPKQLGFDGRSLLLASPRPPPSARQRHAWAGGGHGRESAVLYLGQLAARYPVNTVPAFNPCGGGATDGIDPLAEPPPTAAEARGSAIRRRRSGGHRDRSLSPERARAATVRRHHASSDEEDATADGADGADGGGDGGAAAASEAHQTRALADALGAVHGGGGVALCVPFLRLGAAQREAAVRIILALLHSDDAACRDFCEAQPGFGLLLHALGAPSAEGGGGGWGGGGWGGGGWSGAEDAPCTELLELLFEAIDARSALRAARGAAAAAAAAAGAARRREGASPR